MRKFLAFCVTAALVVGLVAGCSKSGGGDKIRIGGVFNLTGSFSSIEVLEANGAKLAVKEINAAGGINGKQIELVIIDSKSDPATAANVTTQMIEQEKAQAVIGFSDSDYVLAAGPIAQKAGIPFVVVGATSPKLPSQVGDKVFMVPFGDNVQAAVGAEYAFSKLGAKTAYLLLDKGAEYTKLLAAYFKDRWTELGGQIVLEDTYISGDKDMSAQITKLKGLAAAPDVLFISSGPDDVGTVVKQFREAGITTPIMGGDGYDTPLLTEIAGSLAENVYFTTHSLMDAQKGTEPVQKFMAAYQKEYGNPPENAFAALGYDAIVLLADAMKRAGSADPAKVTEALAATQNLAAVSGAITYQPGVHVPQKGVTVIKVENSKLTLAAELAPEKVPNP